MPKNNPENGPKMEDTVLLRQDQYEELIRQLQEKNADLVELANTFQAITSLFSGKTSGFGLTGAIMGLITDKKQLQKFEHIVPIIEKYIPKPQTKELE